MNNKSEFEGFQFSVKNCCSNETKEIIRSTEVKNLARVVLVQKFISYFSYRPATIRKNREEKLKLEEDEKRKSIRDALQM